MPKNKIKILSLIFILIILNVVFRNYHINRDFVLIKSYDFSSNKMLLHDGTKKFIVINKNIKSGGYYKVKYEVNELNKNTQENGFNEYFYYMSKGIYAKCYVKEYKLIKKKYDLRFLIKEILYKRLSFYGSKSYIIFSILFGDKSLIDYDELVIYKELGLIHLFVVSGLHIFILVNWIEKILLFFRFPRLARDFCKFLLIIFLVFITNFHVSSIRSLIIFLINLYEFYFCTKYDNVQKISFSSFLILFFNPYNAFSISFVLGTICYYAVTQKGVMFMYIIALPIMIGMGVKFSIIYILFSLIFTNVLSKILPYIMLSVIFKRLTFFIKPIIDALFYLINIVYGSNYVEIKIFPFNYFSIHIYYFLFLFMLISNENIRLHKFYKNNKVYIFLFIAFLIILSQSFYFNYLSRGIHFIDVGQGDATLIVTNKNKKILIDTGQSKNIVNYLNNHGIDKIDYVFISHYDLDHSKMLDNIDYNILYTSHYKESKKVINLKKRDVINIDDYTFKVVLPKNICDSSNKDSMCIYVYSKNSSYLFTGDVSKSEFYKFDYPVDILKAAHHGSKYSINKEKIRNINPKSCVISYGKNKYNHPSSELVSFLKRLGIKIYKTKEDGSIHFIDNN